jgi:hypothetical protein
LTPKQLKAYKKAIKESITSYSDYEKDQLRALWGYAAED